ncbi:MAG TPA: hypothetical protein ENN30_01245 [Candidatus Woesearchaeota archaeon]|nr:hypothetical protein [Candidatus Woesearchaeota archaeon]
MTGYAVGKRISGELGQINLFAQDGKDIAEILGIEMESRVEDKEFSRINAVMFSGDDMIKILPGGVDIHLSSPLSFEYIRKLRTMEFSPRSRGGYNILDRQGKIVGWGFESHVFIGNNAYDPKQIKGDISSDNYDPGQYKVDLSEILKRR